MSIQALAVNTISRQNAKSLSSIVASVVGIVAILLAGIGILTDMQLSDIVTWVADNFGATFTSVFVILLSIASFAIYQLYKRHNAALWQEVGLQSANGISTLALTFTLLGISLGIGALSEQSLGPDNVDTVISLLTSQFSMAFMTTVVGLPTATAVRAWVAIITAKHTSSAHAVRQKVNEEN